MRKANLTLILSSQLHVSHTSTTTAMRLNHFKLIGESLARAGFAARGVKLFFAAIADAVVQSGPRGLRASPVPLGSVSLLVL